MEKLKAWRDIPTSGFLRSLLPTKGDHADEFLNVAIRHGSLIRLGGLGRLCILADAEGILYVTKSNEANYNKRFIAYRILRRALGGEVLTSVGRGWWHRRRMLQPHFTHRSMPAVADICWRVLQARMPRFEMLADRGMAFDLGDELLSLTLQVALEALFSEVLSYEQTIALMQNFIACYQFEFSVAAALTRFIRVTPLSIRAFWAERRLAQYCTQLISKRRAMQDVPNDLFQTILSGVDKNTGERLTDKDIIGELRTFIATGHETTGNLLLWLMCELDRSPQVSRRLEQELDQHFSADHSDVLSMLEGLDYNNRVFKEGLRLHPPIWCFSRRAIADDVVLGYRIPKGAVFHISPYILHRLPRYWPDPDRFDPDRFSPEKEKSRPKGAYIPFGFGPHRCIAAHFASVQGPLILAVLKRYFNIELLTKDWERQLLVTMRPKHPVYARLSRRKAGEYAT
jgi:cytochrome P450